MMNNIIQQMKSNPITGGEVEDLVADEEEHVDYAHRVNALPDPDWPRLRPLGASDGQAGLKDLPIGPEPFRADGRIMICWKN